MRRLNAYLTYSAYVSCMVTLFCILCVPLRADAAAHKHGKWVGLCGEFASNPLAAPLLLGMGLDEFSMSHTAIPGIKTLMRKLSLKECKKVAKHALRLPKSESVQAYLESIVDQVN